MASINQLVSEIVHAVGQPDNVPLRRNVKYAIIHTRNELIRQSYANNRYIDKGLLQRVKLSLIDVPDSDLFGSDELGGIDMIKRTTQKVPTPTRLTNNLPFQSVRTAGSKPINIAFVREHTTQFYNNLPGFCSTPTYDYINGYIYLAAGKNSFINNLGSIIVESVFQYPQITPIETIDGVKSVQDVTIDDEIAFDDDEFLLPEDMIGPIKDVIFKRNLLDVPRQTNEAPKENIAR